MGCGALFVSASKGREIIGGHKVAIAFSYAATSVEDFFLKLGKCHFFISSSSQFKEESKHQYIKPVLVTLSALANLILMRVAMSKAKRPTGLGLPFLQPYPRRHLSIHPVIAVGEMTGSLPRRVVRFSQHDSHYRELPSPTTK